MLDRLDALQWLLDAGVDVNASTHNATALSAAAGQASVNTVRWLLDRGADIDAYGEPRGSTPLHAAIEEGRLDVVRLLIERGADPDILEGNPGRNALAAARFWDEDEIADYLEGLGVSEVVLEPEPVDVESPAFAESGRAMGPGEWLDSNWGHVRDAVGRHGIDALGAKNRTFFLVGYLIHELANGGADQLYANPSAAFTQAMAEALDRVGASELARTLRTLNALFPGGDPARDQGRRLARFEGLPPEVGALAAELEGILDECRPEDGECALLARLHDHYHA